MPVESTHTPAPLNIYFCLENVRRNAATIGWKTFARLILGAAIPLASIGKAQTLPPPNWSAFEVEGEVRFASMQPNHVLFRDHVISLLPVTFCRNGNTGVAVMEFGAELIEPVNLVVTVSVAFQTEDRRVTSATLWAGHGDGQNTDLLFTDFISITIAGNGDGADFIVDSRGLASVAYAHRQVCGL